MMPPLCGEGERGMGNKPCSDAANHISQPYKPTNRIASCGDATSILISHDPTSRGGRCFSSAMREEPGEDMAGDGSDQSDSAKETTNDVTSNLTRGDENE